MENKEMIECICVDDEPLAREVISKLIVDHPRLKLVASFSNAIEAKEWISGNNCDVVFTDINMPGINGIDFANAIRNADTLVVFTTAYSEYAVEAFEIDALDFLLKPISPARIAKTAERIDEYYQLRASQEDESLEHAKGHIYVKSDSRLVKVSYADIRYVEAFADYVKIWCADGKRIVTLQTMKNMEKELPSDLFVRIHRSFIVNIPSIREVKPSSLQIADLELPIGKNYKEGLMTIIQKNRLH